MRRPVRRATVALLCAALLLALAPSGFALPGTSRLARAAEYTMATTARYDVQPEDRRIVVAADVTFKNTTPNPAGQFSVFNVVDLAIHSGAASVAASDSRGALRVNVATRNGVNVVSVSPRTPVRYNQTMTFTLTYVLPDAASPDIRIRPSAIVFPAWSFGTSGTVTIVLPADYEVRVDGDALTAHQDPTRIRLESGAVADPTTWLARVTAVRPSDYTTLRSGVVLASGTVDLEVRSWTDDAAWGEATMALLTQALPLLEEGIGLDYPRVGPLVVVESVPDLVGELSEPVAEAGEIAVGFNQPPFTTLHQVAHIWLSEQLVGDRWIREGFASQSAAGPAAALSVALPYDPTARSSELAAAAFPLISWGAGEATAEQDAFGYAASWALAERLAAAVGADALRMAWGRIAAGMSAYEPIAPAPPTISGRPITPVDSRRLLDHLEAVSGMDLAAEFAAHVFDEAAAAELPLRAAARQAHAGLLVAAGEWGAPDPVLADLAAWRFDEAQAAIAEATAWLAARDELVAAIDAAGLTTPDRLRDRYRASGGGPDAQDELEAEAALVAAYSDVRAQIARRPSLVEQVGLLGGEEPSARLAEASALFAEGDLRGAAEEVDAARARLAGAFADGAVRLGSAAAVLIVLLLAIVAIRRRRARGYTARP
jgi:hypothetical protein